MLQSSLALAGQSYPLRNLEQKVFYFALLTSALVHICGVIVLSIIYLPELPKSLKKVEVSYLKIKAKTVPQPSLNPSPAIKGEKISTRSDIFEPKEKISSDLVKDIIKYSDKGNTYQKEPLKVKLLDTKRTISVPVLKSEKITNPKYLSYTDKIRQKIKERAYGYVDHPDFESGEVYLAFVLLSNGSLKEVQIIEEKTKAENFLKTVGVRSIRESEPFPTFPKDLDYPELPFNIVVSFELKD